MQFNDAREGNIFNIPFSSQTLSTAGNWDIFFLTAPSGSRVQILDLQIGQQSTSPTGIQALGVGFFVGSTTTSSTSTAIAGVNTKRWAGTPTAGSSIFGPSTAYASTTSASLVYANAFEANSGKFIYRPNEEYGVPIVVTNSQKMFIRLTQPQVAVVCHATLTIKEIGYGLPA